MSTVVPEGPGSSEPNGAPRSFSKCDRVKLIWAAVLYAVDIGTDVFGAMNYCANGHWTYFGFTVALVVVSPLITVVSNVRDYLCATTQLRSRDYKVTKTMWTIRFVCTFIFPLAPYPRFFDYYRYGSHLAIEGVSERSRETYLNLMSEEFEIVSYIRLREAFLEAAPQLALHVYIAYHDGFRSFDGFQYALVASSLLSLAWTLATLRPFLQTRFVRKARAARDHAESVELAQSPQEGQPLQSDRESTANRRGEDTPWCGVALLVIAHALQIASRFAVFSLGGWPVLAMVGVHLMAFTVLLFKRGFLENEWAKKLSILPLIAIVSVFSYVHNDKCFFNCDDYLMLCVLEGGFIFGFRSITGPGIGIYLFLVHTATLLSSYLFFSAFYWYERGAKQFRDDVMRKLACCCKSGERVNGSAALEDGAERRQHTNQHQSSSL